MVPYLTSISNVVATRGMGKRLIKMTKIPIEPIKQESPNDCSITCMRMILGYYGLKVLKDEILNYIIKATPNGGSFLSEVGRFARSKGFNVDLYACNLYLTDFKDANLDREGLLKKLENELKSSKRDRYYDLMLESTIKAIGDGINYIIAKPTIELIKKYLKNNVPLSVRLNYAALVGKQGDPFDSHDVVLSGAEKKTVYLIDPYDASEKFFEYEDLMFAIMQSKVISASAFLLAVKPK